MNFDPNMMAALQKAGPALMQQGSQQQQQLINMLAQMGPPPQVQMPQAPANTAGTALVGNTMGQALGGHPPLPPMTQGESRTNQSVGQLLSQGY